MHFDSLFSLLLILKRLGVKNLFSFYTISVPLSQRCIILKKTLCFFFFLFVSVNQYIIFCIR